MTSKEKCDLIVATLPRFFRVSSDASDMFIVSRQNCDRYNHRECVVIESTNGVFSSWWVQEFSRHYICFFYDDKLWLESVRNLVFICSAL